jgi:hypothetical protein
MENAVIQHDAREPGQLVTSRGRLSLAPDDQSHVIPGQKARPESRKAPLPLKSGGSGVSPPERGAIGTSIDSQRIKDADMAERTRGSSPTNSGTGVSGVNITPPMYAAPVTTTTSLL